MRDVLHSAKERDGRPHFPCVPVGDTQRNFRGELVKKWGQAPRVGVILPVIRIGRRSQSPFFHKLGAKGD